MDLFSLRSYTRPLCFKHKIKDVDGRTVGENKRPVVARANESRMIRIVQSADLSSREVVNGETCSIYFPNCCPKTDLTDLSKTQIYAGIMYDDGVLNVSTEESSDILYASDLESSPCPLGKSWQYDLDYIRCKPIACPAGQEVQGYTCQHCPPGKFKPTSGIQPCDTCPSNTYSSQNGSTVCDPCPDSSKTQRNGRNLDSRSAFAMMVSFV